MRRAALMVVALAAAAAAQEAILIRGAMIHPLSGPAITGSSLLIHNGVIADIGPKVAAPRGARVIDAKGLHLYPGMIDSGTSIGMAEVDSIRETRDTAEIGDFHPQLRTIVAVNPASDHIPVARANGITSVLTLPDGGIIAGQAAMIHLDGWTWEEMEVSKSVAMHLRFPLYAMGGGARGGGGQRAGGARTAFTELKRRHDDEVRKLHDFFEQSRRYQKAKAAGGPGFRMDHRLEAMLPVLDRKLPVIITAARSRAVREAIEFADREKIRAVLAGLTEAGEILGEIRKRNIPVILGPTLALPVEEDAPYDSRFTLPVDLHKQGILFAFATFDSADSRNLPYQAAAGVAFGLPQEEALKAVTLNPAKIWGLDDKIGSIEKNKWADLILTDGDPLEIRTHVRQMFIRGKLVSLENRHKSLYEKYLARP